MRWLLLFAAVACGSTRDIPITREQPLIPHGESQWTGSLSVDATVNEDDHSITVDIKSYRLRGTRYAGKNAIPFEVSIDLEGKPPLGMLLYTVRRFDVTVVGQLVGTRSHPRLQVREVRFGFRE